MSVGAINYNAAAAVALFNLNTTQNQVNSTQNRISTGLKVSSTKDDSAIYQIAQNLRSDIGGISAVRTSLDRAKSTLDVTIGAAESVSDLLVRARELAINASDNGLDDSSRSAIASDFTKLTQQIDSVVTQAEFNGVNLLKNSPDQISAINSVSSNSQINRLTVNGQSLNSSSGSALYVSTATTVAAAQGDSLGTLSSGKFGAQVGAAVVAADNSAAGITFSNTTGKFTVDSTGSGYVAATGVVTISVGGRTFTATAAKGATGSFDLTTDSFKASASGNITVTAIAATDQKTVGGLDLTKFADRSSALSFIDNYASNVKTYLSNLGSASRQLDLQISFTDKLRQSYNAGISNLVDADLASESARLQSLQTKQQLGVQALSIANQAPQSLLSLFR